MSNAPYTLILLRHGESVWNAENLFTGWVDVDLTDKGRAEATRAGELLAEADILPDIVHTSVLQRAIKTSQLALDACDRLWIPVIRSWRLNERHYGALQGKNKKETLEQYGEEQFMLWRRSYIVPPPPIDPNDKWAQTGDARYAAVPPEALPDTECLSDVVERLMPYWQDVIVAEHLRAGMTVMVAAHGNSLRAMVKHLDRISDHDIASLNIPTGIPLVYRLNEDLEPIVPGGQYLDPKAAIVAAAAVAAQGKK
ncbi:MAG: phosphoglyceromutase [Actinobacteria bacterium]|nr:MAG: phosphoglyceromutase [Actinomycetota bacterium]